MYRHSVTYNGPAVIMTHGKEVTRPSGLVAFEELGITAGTITAKTDPRESVGLVLPTTYETWQTHMSRTDAGHEPLTEGAIECPSIIDFVSLGVERWRLLIQNLGGVTGIRSYLAEKRKADPDHTTHVEGSEVLASPSPTRFAGYYAVAEEIEAMEAIARRANSLAQSSQPPTDPLYSYSQYL